MDSHQYSPIRKHHLNPDPIRQLQTWLHEIEQVQEILPNAMTLATADNLGRPSARVVLLRGIDERGLVFFTNYESRKARELEDNPRAALLFYWPELSRQVRVEGKVARVEGRESDSYFSVRPRGNQIEAHASPQSQVIENREFLHQRFTELSQQFAETVIPRPENWGGYRVVPDMFEFWQAGEHRLHDRLRYRKNEAGEWMIERLGP